jgi:hypothetical protein
VDFISRKDKRDNINAFLEFASKQRVIDTDYKFNRDGCYDRKSICGQQYMALSFLKS